MENKMYIIQYSKGVYDSYEIIDIFVTENKEKAERYVEKFNKKLECWQHYYKDLKYELSDEEYFNREDYWKIENILECDKAFIKEIELR